MRGKILLFILISGLCQIFLANSAFAKKIKVETPQNQYSREQKVLRTEEKEKYKRSLLPQS